MKMINFLRPVWGLLVIGLLLSGCKKEQITTYEDHVVGGNTPPPYSGINDTQIEIYVSKLYIDILGEQASQTQIATDVAYLKSKKLRLGARDTLITQIMTNDAYYVRLYNNAKAKFIGGINDFQLNQEIASQNYIISFLYSTGDTFSAQVTEVNRDKLVLLRDADSLYKVGTISVNKFYGIFSDNGFYDEINMGSLNFVQACFENYFLRSATASETTNGVKMVDGESKIILLKNGNSKDDFIKILTESDEFYEGLVRDNFRGFLSRDPSSYEAYKASFDFKNSSDLQEMQQSILKTDEYAGF